MRRLHAGRELRIDADVSPTHEIRGRREDLDEMLGNLLDNACKWARGRVVVRSSYFPAALDLWPELDLPPEGESFVVIVVEDDGPGIDPALRDAVLQRGVRADEAAPGSGLGLAIVRELAELYGGTVSLGAAQSGGLCARLTLPSAH